MECSGSRIIIECLREQKVDVVFGYPGGAILPLYDALREDSIHHVLTVHEQGAAHAADGYARASGKVGVCIATSGPGATNLVTGLATAFMDSVPLVAITGQVATPFLGRDAFQGVDVTGITMPITKHNFLVTEISNLADVLREAFALAREGRPGPVLIDIPRDVLTAHYHYQKLPLTISAHSTSSVHSENTEIGCKISKALALLYAAKRPVMIIGGGIRSGEAEHETLACTSLFQIPVVSTLMGLGILPTRTSYFLGMTGMHGHKAANRTIAASDLILAVGTRFSDRVTSDRGLFVEGKTIVHLDVDAGEVGRNITPDVELIGDLRVILSTFIHQAEKCPLPDISDWWRQIDSWRHGEIQPMDAEGLLPAWIMEYMSETTNNNPVLWVTDVGQHQMWAAQHLQLFSSRSWITSGGMGTMGFGLPAAMGAQLACPEKRAIVICGDGGFKMTGMELYTIVNNKVPVICVILDNHSLGMVRQLQYVFCSERYTTVDLPPFDFAGFARICGVPSFNAKSRSEFASVFSQALADAGPTVIVAEIAADIMVDPMVQPGRSIDQFVSFRPDGKGDV